METYNNPIARNGDFADPFVLRHDGRYYLYCTNPDVRCWSSSDLVTWELEGPSIDEDEFPGLVPFAPEVIYSDGSFYMYTSPSGHGHFVLRSASPTGSFRRITENVGHAIDGNVFIDDDGQWYFYWADDEGIWGCDMPSPTEFGAPVFTGIHMNGWTEGPFVSKRDGWYHMTLTGNHYLSPGYRINAAFSEHPLTGYRNDPLNPILVNTSDGFLGLGHSSSVSGPDLVSTYIVYHNLNPDKSRDLDIDRQVWNGRSLQVLGPTSSAPVPAAPDYSCDWTARGIDGWLAQEGDLVEDGGAGQLLGSHCRAVWRAATAGEAFTAEVNLTPSPTAAMYGLSLASPHDGDYLTLLIDRDAHAVGAARVIHGSSEVVLSAPLPRTFVHDTLHCWYLVFYDGRLRLFIDGRLQASVFAHAKPDSMVGVVASGGPLCIGYCALTNTVAERAHRTAAKPVPGRFWAALSADAVPAGARTTGATFESALLEPGSSLTNDLNLQRPGRYDVSLSGAFDVGDVLAFDVDHHEQSRVHVDHASHVVVAEVELISRHQRLGIRSVYGHPVITLVTTSRRTTPAPATISGEISGYGKRVLTPGHWGDLTVSATLSLRLGSPDAHGDIIFRATQLSEGGEGDDPRLGIDFFLGYSIQVYRSRLVLARHDYDQQVLAAVAAPLDDTVPHSVVIQAIGGTFTVNFDGTPVIRHDEQLPHLSGQVGFRTSDAELRIERLHVTAGDE